MCCACSLNNSWTVPRNAGVLGDRGNKRRHAWRTVDGLVVIRVQDLRLPWVGLVAQVGPRCVADARGDARVHQGLQRGAASSGQVALSTGRISQLAAR
jgi:hypothetical protein